MCFFCCYWTLIQYQCSLKIKNTGSIRLFVFGYFPSNMFFYIYFLVCLVLVLKSFVWQCFPCHSAVAWGKSCARVYKVTSGENCQASLSTSTVRSVLEQHTSIGHCLAIYWPWTIPYSILHWTFPWNLFALGIYLHHTCPCHFLVKVGFISFSNRTVVNSMPVMSQFYVQGLRMIFATFYTELKPDGVGPVDNRPFTDKLHLTPDTWHVTWWGEHSLKMSAP